MEHQKSLNQLEAFSSDGILFDKSPIPKWIYDINTLQFLAVNEAALMQYGYTKSEFLHLTAKDIRPVEDIQLLKNIISINWDKNNLNSGVYRHKKKNGEIIYVQVYAHPIEFDNKKARLTIAININEKIAAENENKYLTNKIEIQKRQEDEVFNSIEEYVWSRRIDNNEFVYCNNACYKVFGYTKQEMYNDGHDLFLKIIHPEDKERIMESMVSLYKGITPKVYHEFRLNHKDGSLRNIASTIILNKGIEGAPDTIIAVTKDITELVQSEKRNRDKAVEMDRILSTINDGYITLDKDWNYTYVNSVYLDLAQSLEHELIGKNIWELFPNLIDTKFYKEYHKAVAEQVTTEFESYAPYADKWVLVRAYPTTVGLTVCMTDITEQKKLLNKIIDNEQNLKALIDNTTDYIFSVDRNLKIISINQPFKELKFKITGVMPESGDPVVPDGFGNIETRKDWENLCIRALSGEVFSNIKKERINNKNHYVETRFNPIRNKSGEVVGISCFAKDITEHILLNEKIANDEANLLALINNTKDRIFSVDKDFKLIAANEPFKLFIKKLFGKIPELGQPIILTEIINEDINKWIKYAQKALNGESFSVIDESMDKSSLSYIESNINPIYNNLGQIIGVTCFIRDVTEQLIYFNRIEVQNKKLKDIAWIQSHQIRAKVATILGLGQLFNHEDMKDPINTYILDNIIQSSQELDIVIKEINSKAQTVEF